MRGSGFYPLREFSGDVPNVTTGMIPIEREKELKIVEKKADVSGSGFNPSKELDFAIIGWPKTGKDKTSYPFLYSLWFC